MSETRIPEWERWLKNQRSKTREVYSSDPERITSDYNREVKQIENYSGRGLLELIQNADDAGLDSSSPVDVLIELTDRGLFVANSGEPFSRDGIKSLMLSDNSPKQFREECIGYKGLGFRSVLNWSSSVIIHSGEISIGFSETYAAEFLDTLRSENDDVDAILSRRYDEEGISHPIATLSTPKLLSDVDLDNAQLTEVYQHGRDLKKEGYDTVIAIPLFNTDARAQVQEEINELFEELMLFLRHIKDFRIQSPERKEHWRISRRGDKITIQDGSEDPSTWKLFEDSGKIPPKYQDSHQTKNRYEIKIAVPQDFSRFQNNSNLFVFFPTKVSFPFPMLAHATFQVNDSRNHLLETDANRFVAKQLATMMVNAAESNRSKANPWQALQTVSPTGPIGATLSELGGPEPDVDSFEDLLRTEIATRSLIPVQGPTFTNPERALRIKGDFDDILDREHFNDICINVENTNVENQLTKLGVDYIEYSTLRMRLEEIADNLSIDKRAKLIGLLIDNELIEDDVPPQLLIDSGRNLIPVKERTFLPPQGQSVSLPEWVSRHIMHPDLTKNLESYWDLNSVRDLQLKLKPFNVQRYDLATMVQAVVAAANDKVDTTTNRDEEFRWRKKMLQALWNLYQAGAGGVSLSNVSIIVPTRSGGFAKASTLYFTSSYPNGGMVDRLYNNVDTDVFVADPENLELCENTTKLEEFLEWLGVASEPRLERREVDNGDFYDYVLNSLNYPAAFGSSRLRMSAPDELRSTQNRLTAVQTVDRLKKVLKTAEPHAILAWLSSISETLHKWRQDGDQEASLEIKPKYHQNWKSLRDQTLPSHPLWLLRTIEWMPVENGSGQRHAPRTCSMASFARDISPLVGYPTILDETNHPAFTELHIDETAIVTALQNIGITNSIKNLSWESFYQILFELPNRDPNGEIARRVYRTLIRNRDGNPPTELREDFIKNGTLFGNKNGKEDYYPVKKLRYTNTDSIPDPIANAYPLLNLDNRLGAKKVEDLFGVVGLRNSDIDIQNVDTKPHSDAETLEKEIESLKPFIYAFRIDADDNRSELRMIRNLEVRICRSVSATAMVNDNEFNFDLNEGSYLLDDTKAYVVPQPVKYGSLRFNDHLARLIGDVFSDILDTKLGKDVLSVATANDREQRLAVLLDGESSIERLHEARRLVEGEIDSRLIDTPQNVSDGMEQEEDGLDKKEQDIEDEGKIDTEAQSNDTSARDGRNRGRVRGVSAEEKEFEVKTGRTVKLRRTSRPSATSNSGGSGGSSRNPDWKSAEDLAYWFEVDEGRYPMLVSEVQGTDSYRCDILSFDTKDRKESFNETPDQDLIDRYIEVKSSTSQQGSVNLNENQYRQANKYRERFYLYRIYDPSGEDDLHELTILRDPLKHDSTLSWSVSVNPFRTHQTDRYTLDIVTDEETTE